MDKNTDVWRAEQEDIGSGSQKLRVFRKKRQLRFSEVLELWQDDESFRTFFIGLLSASTLPSFRWETPPLLRSSSFRPFEFVLLDSPGLLCKPDAAPFADHFRPDASIVVFENLGKDATLIVPCPRGPQSAYGHLAAFLRSAPEPQRHELWQAVGREVTRRLSDKPLWLSTAGLGVPWLHVRLDSRPKYYAHRLYAAELRT